MVAMLGMQFLYFSAMNLSCIHATHANTCGRHSPGRFFASQQLKLTLAYIALNYEIKPIPSRPENKWFVGSSGPPLDATICIRRRTGTA
jgi:hypothetical protein